MVQKRILNIQVVTYARDLLYFLYTDNAEFTENGFKKIRSFPCNPCTKTWLCYFFFANFFPDEFNKPEKLPSTKFKKTTKSCLFWMLA